MFPKPPSATGPSDFESLYDTCKGKANGAIRAADRPLLSWEVLSQGSRYCRCELRHCACSSLRHHKPSGESANRALWWSPGSPRGFRFHLRPESLRELGHTARRTFGRPRPLGHEEENPGFPLVDSPFLKCRRQRCGGGAGRTSRGSFPPRAPFYSGVAPDRRSRPSRFLCVSRMARFGLCPEPACAEHGRSATWPLPARLSSLTEAPILAGRINKGNRRWMSHSPLSSSDGEWWKHYF